MIQTTESGTLITGADIEIYRVLTIRQGLKALQRGMKLTRTATPKVLFQLASNVTGTVYKRGQYDIAIRDLSQWLDAQRTNGQ